MWLSSSIINFILHPKIHKNYITNLFILICKPNKDYSSNFKIWFEFQILMASLDEKVENINQILEWSPIYWSLTKVLLRYS